MAIMMGIVEFQRLAALFACLYQLRFSLKMLQILSACLGGEVTQLDNDKHSIGSHTGFHLMPNAPSS